MSVKIRLSRVGRRRVPAYRIIVIDARKRNSGKYKEKLGFYNAISKEGVIDGDLVDKWIKCGAIMSDTVKRMLKNKKINIKRKDS